MTPPPNHVAPTDYQLVTAILAGDESAFTTLVTRHRDYVFSVCMLHSINRSDAEECTTDALLRVHRYLHTFRWDSAFTTWLYKVAKGCCLNLRRPSCYNPIGKRHIVIDEKCRLVATAPDPRETLSGEDVIRVVRGEMKRLIPSHRATLAQVVATVESGGAPTYLELASTLGVSVNTAKSKLLRARRALAKRLLDKCPELEPLLAKKGE